jgi:O-antigen/teichoic acid export membrane protein
MSSVRRALGFSVLERLVLIALNLLSYILLARLLTPEEIGLYSVAAALVGILQVLREFGIGSYLIQANDLRQEQLNSALGLAMALALLAFSVTWVASPLAARFYGAEGMTTVLRVVALNFLLLPFCSIGQGLLRRSMKFKQLMHINLTAGLLGVGLTMALAYGGVGPSSLAWGSVATNLIVAAGCWISLGKHHRPQRASLRGWESLMNFGRQTVMAGVLTTVAVDINDLVIGRVLGLAPVALLSRAMGLMNLWQRDLMLAVRNVAQPAFAQARRDGQALEPLYIRGFAAVLVMSLPYYGLVGMFPLESLRLLAGPQWDAAVPLVRVFAVAGALLSFSTLVPTLLLACGRVDLASQLDIRFALLRMFAMVTSALVFKSLMAVALALALVFAISPVLFLHYKRACVPADRAAMLSATWRSTVVTALAMMLPLAVTLAHGMGRTEPVDFWRFFLVALSVPPVWLAALRWCGHPLAQEPLLVRMYSALLRPLGHLLAWPRGRK